MDDKETKPKKVKDKKLLKIYHTADLEEAGYGVCNTISKRVKMGTFPQPLNDGLGRPIWTSAMLEEYDASLELYHSTPIKHFTEANAA